MSKSNLLEQALKDLQSHYRESVTQLLIAAGQDFIKANPEVKTIGFGSAYEYNDNDYDHNYRMSADEIEINGKNLWEVEDIDDEDFEKKTKIESRDKFGDLAQELEEIFAPFDGNLHTVFGNNFKLIISKSDLKIENDAYEY